MFTPLSRLKMLFASLFGALAFSYALVPIASAADPSIPYRNYPGFVCYFYNNRGECTDFSYQNDPSGIQYGSTFRPSALSSSTSSRSVTVRITGSPANVERNGTISYSLYLKNNDAVSRNVDVRAVLDPDTFYTSASDGGYEYRNREVRWDRITLRARDSLTLRLRVRVASNVSNGDTLRIRVTAGNDTDEATTRVGLDRTYDDCYDRYGRPMYYDGQYYYDSRYQYNSYNSNRYYDPYYYDSRSSSDCYYNDNYYNDPYYGSDRFTVRISGFPTIAEPGQNVDYNIVIGNDSPVERFVDVRGELDSRMYFVSASDNPSVTSRTVRWDRFRVPANSTRTLTVRVNTDRLLRDGDIVRLRVTAGNGSDEETTSMRFRYRF